MHQSSTALAETSAISELTDLPAELPGDAVVSTHVLVTKSQLEQLRQLAQRTRIAQSEYLREAVDDLLSKYQRGPNKGTAT